MSIPRWLRPFVRPIALAGWFVALIKPALWMIGLMGDVEFISTNLNAIGQFLETGWGTLATVMGGAALIGYSSLRGYHAEPLRQAPPAATATTQNDSAISRLISFDEPDYEAWDQVRELALIRAACFWAEQEPVDHPMMLPPEANPRYTMLREACRAGEFKAFVRYTGGAVRFVSNPDFGHFIRRDDLEKFAEARGEKPKFFFPEERNARI